MNPTTWTPGTVSDLRWSLLCRSLDSLIDTRCSNEREILNWVNSDTETGFSFAECILDTAEQLGIDKDEIDIDTIRNGISYRLRAAA